MNNIFSYYTKYREHIDEYNRFNERNNNINNISSLTKEDKEKYLQQAKVIAEPILLLDSYEHKKAEDAETFFQTYNIELMSLTGLITTFPIAITKLIPLLRKYSEHLHVKKLLSGITKYENTAINIGKKSIPLKKALSLISIPAGGIFFAAGIKKSLESQLGMIRKSSFDGTQNLINDSKLYAIHTKEQEAQINSIVQYEEKTKSAVNKLKEKVNIKSSLESVKDYHSTLKEYKEKKNQYNKNIEPNTRPLSPEEKIQAEKERQFFTNLLKNVEHDVLEDLRKVETISNISYSSLFAGGFLEYLLTDKLTSVLNIQNKLLKTVVKFAVPLITYFILNKNISNLENKVICATKYKHLKAFTEHPEVYGSKEQNKKKQTSVEFLKTVYKDLKDYEKFSENELPKLQARMEAKKQIQLTPKQVQEAKLLKDNLSKVINKHREHVYEQSVGIKSLSETILGPIDIIATALGGILGNNLAKRLSDKKHSSLMTGLGAVIAFIPAAIIEAKLVKQQKLSEKIAAMLTINDIQDERLFADNSDYKSSEKYSGIKKLNAKIFDDFIMK